MNGATPEETATMRHMLGADSPSPGFRNHGVWGDDDPHLNAMVEKGLVSRGFLLPGGLRYYHVNDEWCKGLGITVSR